MNKIVKWFIFSEIENGEYKNKLFLITEADNYYVLQRLEEMTYDLDTFMEEKGLKTVEELLEYLKEGEKMNDMQKKEDL
jgi:hypothetical protein